MKTCEEIELTISSYVDGEIVEADRGPMFEHLASCENCDGFLQDAIRVRIEAARVSRIPAPGDVVPSFPPPGMKESRRYYPDAPAVPQAALSKSIGMSVRTLALAVLVIVIGCIMFSTTISFSAGGTPMVQSPQENRVR